MVHRNYLSLCLATVFSLFIGISAAQAAKREFSVNYNGGTSVAIATNDKIELLPRDFYGMRPLRDPMRPNTNVTLRFFSLGHVSGCSNTSDYIVRPKSAEGKMDIQVTDSELQMNKEKHRYGNYDCTIKGSESYFDVDLSVPELITNNIRVISLKSARYGNFMNINVNANKDRIIFNSNYEGMPGMPPVSVEMVYWLYPQGTIILSVPQAKTDQDLTENIKAFGLKNGLVPLNDIIKDFKLPKDAKNYYFFYDHAGKYKHTLAKSQNFTQAVGNLRLSRTVFGAKGPHQEPYLLEVQASLPGKDQ